MNTNYSKKINLLITSLFIFSFAAFVIANTEERSAPIDPDGDGYSDGNEVKSGYDPLKPAPNDKLETNSNNDNPRMASTSNPSPLLSNFASETKEFIDSKKDQPVTQQDIQKFVDEKLKGIVADEELSVIDYSKVKIKKQDFKGLNEFEALVKEKDDWDKYITEVFTAITSKQTNKELLAAENLEAGLKIYADKYKTVSTLNPDYDFFRELLPSITEFIKYGQEELEVPERVLDMHIKLLSLLQGYVDLANPDLPKIEDDFLIKMTVLNGAENLNKILLELISKDMKQYNNKFDIIK